MSARLTTLVTDTEGAEAIAATEAPTRDADVLTFRWEHMRGREMGISKHERNEEWGKVLTAEMIPGRNAIYCVPIGIFVCNIFLMERSHECIDVTTNLLLST